MPLVDTTAVARELSEQGARLIVFPEKVAVLQSAWRAGRYLSFGRNGAPLWRKPS